LHRKSGFLFGSLLCIPFGPSLAKIATRSEIAGHFANTPQNMVQWLQHPQQLLPGNGMPDMGVTDSDARNIAAYLYTNR